MATKLSQQEMLDAGITSFYQYEKSEKVGVYDVVGRKYVQLSRPEGMMILKQQPVVSQNAGASIRDLGDGVACLEFHTKMNSLDEDIMNMAMEAMQRLETDFDGLVIGNEADNWLYGGPGDDTIDGRGGDDIIEGGVGSTSAAISGMMTAAPIAPRIGSSNGWAIRSRTAVLYA